MFVDIFSRQKALNKTPSCDLRTLQCVDRPSVFFLLGFTPCKAEQLQEKEAQKD